MQVVLANCSRFLKASARKNVTRGKREACRLPENRFILFVPVITFVDFILPPIFFFSLLLLLILSLISYQENTRLSSFQLRFSPSVFSLFSLVTVTFSRILTLVLFYYYFLFFCLSLFSFPDKLPWRRDLISFYLRFVFIFFSLFPLFFSFKSLLFLFLSFISFTIYVLLSRYFSSIHFSSDLYVVIFSLFLFFSFFFFFLFIYLFIHFFFLELLSLINVIGSWHGVLVGERHDSNFLAGRRLLHARQVPPLI